MNKPPDTVHNKEQQTRLECIKCLSSFSKELFIFGVNSIFAKKQFFIGFNIYLLSMPKANSYVMLSSTMTYKFGYNDSIFLG